MLRAEPTIVCLHEKTLFPLCVSLELGPWDDELGVGVVMNGQAKFFRKGGKGVKRVEFIRIKKVNFGEMMFFNPRSEDAAVICGRGRVSELVIKNSEFLFSQASGVVTHGRVKQGQLLLMVSKMGAARCGLNHADEQIGCGGDEERVGGEELVTKNPNEAHLLRVEQIGAGQAMERDFLFCRKSGE